VLNPSENSELLKEEIFGPILPIIPYVNFDEVVNKHIRKREKPLVVYYSGSTSSSNYKRLLN